MKSQLLRKGPDAGKDGGQEEKGTEDEMVGWHHQLDGHGFEQAPRDGEGQGSCSPWGHKESDVTEQLYNNLVKVCTRAVLTLIIGREKIS